MAKIFQIVVLNVAFLFALAVAGEFEGGRLLMSEYLDSGLFI